MQGTSSEAAQREAIRSIPLAKLDASGRAKVAAVLDNVTVFRRMPVRVVSCDRDLYLFVVRHPDVVVNIWEVLGVGQLHLGQTGPDRFHVEGKRKGPRQRCSFFTSTHDTHLIYGDWKYTGRSRWAERSSGRCLAILKRTDTSATGDGRSFISSHLDAFLNVKERAGVRTAHPDISTPWWQKRPTPTSRRRLLLSAVCRTAEVNSRGFQRLAGRLNHVEPEVRQQLADIAADMAKKPSIASQRPVQSNSRGWPLGRTTKHRGNLPRCNK